MKFIPQNNYLFVKTIPMPSRGMFSIPMADPNFTVGEIISGDDDLEGRGVLFDNRGLSGVWIKNVKHTFIKKNEIISLVEFPKRDPAKNHIRVND